MVAGAGVTHSYEVGIPFRHTRAGAVDRSDGFSSHRDALRHSRPGSGCSVPDRTNPAGSRTGWDRSTPPIDDREALLQSTDSRRQDYVPTADAWNEGEAGMADSTGAEPGTDSRRNSGCDRAKRACC